LSEIDPTSFREPDWTAPLEVAEYVARCTEAHRLKGLFVQSVVDIAHRAGQAPGRARRYLPFKEYPCSEYIQVAEECARLVWPRHPVRQALREFGREAFPTFRSTMIGKVLLAASGDDLVNVFRVAPRVYEVSITPGSVRSSVEQGRALLELRDIPTFADSFHVGALEGVLETYHARGSVRVRVHTLFDVDLLVEWA
jgi:uncharacterized protein (TIGR02265 family)